MGECHQKELIVKPLGTFVPLRRLLRFGGDLQEEFQTGDADLTKDRMVECYLSTTLGHVITEGDRMLFVDGVNILARLEARAGVTVMNQSTFR